MCGAGGSDARAHIACISSSSTEETSLRVDICVYRKPREKTEQQVEGFTPTPLSFYGFDNMTDKCTYVSARGCAGLP